ncbi:MAG: hypothetical protein ABR923_08950 [Terracidiphilus sp.]
MSTFLRDLHYAMRSLRRSPGFAATAIVTLALGIGATAAICQYPRQSRGLDYVSRSKRLERGR